MKRRPLIWTFGLALVVLTTQAFQCGSPEFTGAKVYEQQSNWKEAARLYEQETQKNPANAEAWFRLGRIRGLNLNDDAGMNVALGQAVKLNKEFEREAKILQYNRWASHVNDGVSNLKRGSADSLRYFDAAASDFKMAIVAWPDTSITYQFLGHAYVSRGDDKNAIEAYTKAWMVGKDKDSYKRTGRLYLQRAIERMNVFDTTNAVAIKALKSLSDVDKGTYTNDVLHAFGAPDAKKKDSRNSKQEVWSYNQYNLQLTLEGGKVVKRTFSKPYAPVIDSTAWKAGAAEYDNAVTVFEGIKKEDPKDNENLTLLLQAYVGANRIPEATKAFKQAVVNDPGNKMNHFVLGVLYRTINDFTNAIAEYEEALKIDPNYVDALFDIGATQFNWGLDLRKSAQEKGEDDPTYKEKFKAALPYLEKVAELKKDDPNIFQTLAAIYASMGDAAKAAKALDEADNLRKAK